MTDKPPEKPGEWIKDNREKAPATDRPRQDKATWDGKEWNHSKTEEGGYAEKQP